MEPGRNPSELKISAVICAAAIAVAALSLGLGWIELGALVVTAWLCFVLLVVQLYSYVRLGMGVFQANLLGAIDPEFRRAAPRKLAPPGISRHPPEWSRSKRP